MELLGLFAPSVAHVKESIGVCYFLLKGYVPGLESTNADIIPPEKSERVDRRGCRFHTIQPDCLTNEPTGLLRPPIIIQGNLPESLPITYVLETSLPHP